MANDAYDCFLSAYGGRHCVKDGVIVEVALSSQLYCFAVPYLM